MPLKGEMETSNYGDDDDAMVMTSNGKGSEYDDDAMVMTCNENGVEAIMISW